MTDLRTAAQQALEACEQRLPLKGQAAIIDELNNLRAALAQQAEPLNLSDPAVQKRLASQWGYVSAAQAEPVGQLAELQAMLRAEVDRLIAAGIQPQRKPLTEEVAALTAQRDALLEALQDLCDTLGECGITERARAAIKAVEEQPDPRRALDELARIDGELGLFNAPPRCPNCGSLEAQNTELDNMLVAMEHAVAQAAAVERKACADICDAHASCEGIAQQCAAAIRARGQA